MAHHADKSRDPHTSLLRMITETKLEMVVTQAALAVVLAEVAKLSPDPRKLVADAAMRILAIGQSGAAGDLDAELASPTTMTAAADRIAGWAEALVQPSKG